MTISVTFMERVRHHLLAAGLMGMTKQQLLQKVRSSVHPASELNELLSVWRKRKWVELFVDDTGSHTRKVVRATQLLYTEWPEHLNAVSAILMNPDVRLGQGLEKTKTDDPEVTDP
jgi:hypothetical protein